MNAFLILPTVAALIWVVHAFFRIGNHKLYRYTFWLLAAGLPLLVLMFFLGSASGPAVSQRNNVYQSDVIVSYINALIAAGLWLAFLLLELILIAISRLGRRRHIQ